MTALVLDAGGLIKYERNDRRVVALVGQAGAAGAPVLVPAAALAQVWRDGRRQVQLSRLLSKDECEVVALDSRQARLAGALCGRSGTSDVVDASVALVATEHDATVVTSDPDDLRRLNPRMRLFVV